MSPKRLERCLFIVLIITIAGGLGTVLASMTIGGNAPTIVLGTAYGVDVVVVLASFLLASINKRRLHPNKERCRAHG